MLEHELDSDTVVAKYSYVLRYRSVIRVYLDFLVTMPQRTFRCTSTHLPLAANGSGTYWHAGAGCRCTARHSMSTYAVRHADTALSICVVSSSVFYELCICPHDLKCRC